MELVRERRERLVPKLDVPGVERLVSNTALAGNVRVTGTLMLAVTVFEGGESCSGSGAPEPETYESKPTSVASILLVWTGDDCRIGMKPL